jgi:hypothetical protein
LVEPGWPIPADQIPADHTARDLAELGRRGASGAVEITGQPGGIVYLRNGYVVWAESPAVPDLRTRLIRSRRLPSAVWDQIARDDGPAGTVGAALVARNLLTRAELERLLQSIVLDALLALTAPFAGECRVTGLWFIPQRSHWADTVLAMDVSMVRRYLDHMTQQLAWYEVTPRWCPQWPAGKPTATLINSGQRAIATLIDGRTTVSELVWNFGLSLHETMASVGQLVHAGMCTLPIREAVPECPARAGLPRRGPLTEARATTHVRATPLEFGLLQRVRQGLQQMT